MKDNNIKKILEMYLDKEEYNIRIRKEEGINVYYNGIEMFTYKNGKFNLNVALFVLNGTNYRNFNEIPCQVKKDLAIIGDLGFKVKIGVKVKDKGYRLDLDYSSNKQKVIANQEEIRNIAEKIRNNLVQRYQVNMSNNSKRMEFYLNDGEIDFLDLLIIMKESYSLTVGKEGIKKINFKERLVLERDNLTKVLNNLAIINEVMKRRINIYLGYPKENIDYDQDFSRTKSQDNQEKQYQQKLMEKLVKKKEEISKNSFFTTDTYIFEMEYNFYAKTKKEKERNTIKGRIDNVFVRDDTLVLVEMKLDTGVIGGTNGLHKHLMDLNVCLDDNKNWQEEITELIKYRNEILEGYKNYYLPHFKKIEKVEYYIICGYKNVNITDIKKAICDIMKKTIIEINKKNVLEANNYYQKYRGYEKMNLLELINKLEKRCQTKIILANEDLTKFEEYIME